MMASSQCSSRIGLSWIAIGTTLTIAYGFGYQRLSMVSLGYTYRDMMVKKTSLHVSNMGWDNENFLESLGQGPEAIEKANEEYQKLKEFGNEDISKDQIERIKQQNENAGSGGEMFKKLLERAEQQQQQNTPHASPPPPSQAAMPPQDTPSAAAAQPSVPPGFENMSVEAQAALFRELLNNKSDSGGVGEEQTAKGTYSPKGIGPDGRKIGRNRDADSIVNSADVYFAQLKLDSSVRNQARFQGDADGANKVFEDPRIRDIKLHVNPHMEEQRKKEAAMLETAQEEMIIMPNAENQAPVNKADTGVSYKDRLRAKKQGLQQQPNKPMYEEPPRQEMYQEAPPLQREEIPAAPQQEAPPKQQQQQEFVQMEVPEDRPPADQRQQIRTLMGMLLKHRGGPGFGSGRLQGAEIDRFDELAHSVLDQLRQEAVPTPPGLQQELSSRNEQIGSSTPPQQYSQPSNPTSANPSATASEDMEKMIAAVQGALQLYKNSPPELQVSLVGTIQATLVTALSTCNRLLDSAQQQDFPQASDPQAESTSASEKMMKMIGAVEGALQLYKNSPPALQASLVGIVQTTLMTAINTCNQILDGGRDSRSLTSNVVYTDVEPEVSQASVAAPVVPSSPAMPSVESSTTQYDGSDENSQFFESVFHRLQAAASGDGKLGLRSNVSPAEAEALADDLVKMRALLVEELDHGIPTGGSGSSSQKGTSARQKYQDMLARAKTEKGDQ